MPSSIAWMDTSAKELRRAQEIIALFQEKEGRDELGIGTVRDALSNALFPGTSVLQTRARYLLFVPWTYQKALESNKSGVNFVERAKQLERTLVSTLQRESADDGIIGARVGEAVQNLPSSIYWNGLQTFGIVNVGRPSDIAVDAPPVDVTTELVTRMSAPLAATPAMPQRFPEESGGGFALSREEAAWLRERILTTQAGTSLALLMESSDVGASSIAELRGYSSPWEHPALASGSLVEQARRFSHAIRGAALLYNLLVAEKCAEEGLTAKAELAVGLEEDLVTWQEQAGQDELICTWHTQELWNSISNTPLPHLTVQFVNAWVNGFQGAIAANTPVAEVPHLRELVADRERRKGRQSRLNNPRMLGDWSGQAGTGQLIYRWNTVRTLTADILEGMAR